MQLFVVDGKDFTNHIKVPSYKVNKREVGETWTDANYKTHLEITRTKVMGDFTLLYNDVDELDEFFDVINNLKFQSNYGPIEMTVYCNNTHSVETVNAFINYEPENEKPHFQMGEIKGFKVTIEEQ